MTTKLNHVLVDTQQKQKLILERSFLFMQTTQCLQSLLCPLLMVLLNTLGGFEDLFRNVTVKQTNPLHPNQTIHLILF